eukprot:TRINITY_DN15224_c0_g1_i2.p1 TRINITY_DN15224_c0_g1~~TRINITY_DN15224_c0_g1_i2.p1  ORF type:complete len:708 (+),score=110.18 TRINITY_DN15224_c0_g1_i2:43-2166(+)
MSLQMVQSPLVPAMLSPQLSSMMVTPPPTPPTPMRAAPAFGPVVPPATASSPATPRGQHVHQFQIGPAEPVTSQAGPRIPAMTPPSGECGATPTHRSTCPFCNNPNLEGHRTPCVSPPVITLGSCEVPGAAPPVRALTPPRPANSVIITRPLSNSTTRSVAYSPPASPMASGPGASRRPRSAQARVNDYSYLSMDATAASAKAKSSTINSPAPRSCAKLIASPRLAGRNATPAPEAIQTGRAGLKNAGVPDSVLETAWAELRQHVAESRPNRDTSSRTEDGWHPDPARLRRISQVLVGVVNQIQEPSLRRVMAVLCEELFGACFRDYTWSYDPREVPAEKQGRLPASSLPVLPEEKLTNVVPYFAVVQSLRDTAKDAIVRRLELEAKATNGSALDSPDGSPPQGRRAHEEVRLREELRHSRLLADTYQSRTLELEKMRIELEDQVRRLRSDREKEDLAKQKLSNEVKRLRADAETAKAAKAAWEADKSAREASAASGRRGPTLSISAASPSKSARPGSALGQRPAATALGLQSSSTFGRAGRGLEGARSPRAGMLSSSATEPSPRRHGTGLACTASPCREAPERLAGRDTDVRCGIAVEGALTETRILKEEALTAEGNGEHDAGEAMAEQSHPCTSLVSSASAEIPRQAASSRPKQTAATSMAAAADAAAGAIQGRVARKSSGASSCASSAASPAAGGRKPVGKVSR